MNEEMAGVWWRPESPQDEISGTLIVSEDELRLDLIGSLKEWPNWLTGENPRYSVIHGATTAGDLLTLQDSLDLGGRMGMGVSTQRLSPAIVFRGDHIPAPADQKWDEIRFQAQYLADWYGKTALSVRHEEPSSSYGVTYTHGDRIEGLTPDAVVAIILGIRVDQQAHRHEMEEWAEARVAFNEPLGLRAAMDEYVVPLQDVVTLATGNACPLTSVSVQSQDLVQELVGRRVPNTIEVFTRSHRRSGSKLPRSVAKRGAFHGGINS